MAITINVIHGLGPRYTIECNTDRVLVKQRWPNAKTVCPDKRRDFLVGKLIASELDHCHYGPQPSMNTNIWEWKEIFNFLKSAKNGDALFLDSDHNILLKGRVTKLFISKFILCFLGFILRIELRFHVIGLSRKQVTDDFERILAEIRSYTSEEVAKYINFYLRFHFFMRFEVFTPGDDRGKGIAEEELRRIYGPK